MVLCEVTGIAPHDGFRWWIVSNVFREVCGFLRVPILQNEIDQPPSRRDLAPRFAGRVFRSGSGLLCPFEVGVLFPQCQHQHRDLARCGDCGLAKPTFGGQSYSPAFQRRETPNPVDQT